VVLIAVGPTVGRRVFEHASPIEPAARNYAEIQKIAGEIKQAKETSP
jgi:hypothetical protein